MRRVAFLLLPLIAGCGGSLTHQYDYSFDLGPKLDTFFPHRAREKAQKVTAVCKSDGQVGLYLVLADNANLARRYIGDKGSEQVLVGMTRANPTVEAIIPADKAFVIAVVNTTDSKAKGNVVVTVRPATDEELKKPKAGK